jgi:hypothetical protein
MKYVKKVIEIIVYLLEKMKIEFISVIVKLDIYGIQIKQVV